MPNANGMSWITPKKRLACYLRDGCACVYCGLSVEQGAKLTLDHLTPREKGGGNEETNLVTACLSCNSSRGMRPLASFVRKVAGKNSEKVMKFIATTRKRKLDVATADALIQARGGFGKAVVSIAERRAA